MNWDALGAMGEIAGAIAVIATLFFSCTSVTDKYARTGKK